MSARIGPTGVLVTDAEPNTEAWYAARHDGIGSSEIAAVLGISPYTSPFDLWWQKRLREVREANDAMGWGTRLEPVIADAFAAAHPEFMVGPTGVIMHKERHWQRCSPDRLIVENLPAVWTRTIAEQDILAALECKSDNNRAGWGEPGTDNIPAHYLAQVRWQLDTLGLAVGYVAVTFGGPPLEYVVEANEADASLMRQAARAFLDSLEAGIAPPIDSHDATAHRLKTLHPDLEETEVQIADDLAAEYLAAVAEYDRVERARDLARNRLMAAIGDGKWAVTTDGRKIATRSVYDVKARVQVVSAHTVHKLIPAKPPKGQAA